MTTFFAPPSKCAAAFSPSVNTPVDSTTMSAPTSPQGMALGSRSAKVFISRSPTRRMLPSSCTSSCQIPWVESRLKRSARLSIGIRSFMATIWMSSSLRSIAALAVSIPIRPKPLIPTLTATLFSSVSRLLCCFHCAPENGVTNILPRQFDQPPQAVVGGALGEIPESGELRERGVGVLEPELEHLPERRREIYGIEGLERPLLAGGGGRGAPGVGRVEVGDAVGVGLRLAEDGPGLVLQNGVVEAHLGEQSRHPVGALGVGDPPSAPPHDPQRGPGESSNAPDELFIAVYKLEVMAPAATRPGQGADALERAPQVGRPVGDGARAAREGELFRRLNRAVALGANLVEGPAEAVLIGGREPGVQPELRAPQAHHRAGDGGARGAEGYAPFVPAPGGEQAPHLRGERGQPRTPLPRAGRGRGAPRLRPSPRGERPRATGPPAARPFHGLSAPAPPPPRDSGRRVRPGVVRSGRARLRPPDRRAPPGPAGGPRP